MVSVCKIDETDRDYWDNEVSNFEAVHPLNAFGWGKVRAIDGWSPTYLLAKRGSSVVGAVMILKKWIPCFGISIMYAPRGPLFKLSDKEALKTLLLRIKAEARKNHAVFARIDPNIEEAELLKYSDVFIEEGFTHLRHRWTFWNTPRDVYRIDLTRSNDERDLFSTLDRQTRKSIRKAQKQGVAIQKATSLSELNAFYKIFKQFSIDKGFMCRRYEYQMGLWNEYILRSKGALFLAIYQGQIIGGQMCLQFSSKCLAMHAVTPYEYRHLRTSEAYVWEAIKWAKVLGCRWFSFRGVGTTPTEEAFKRKFGPEVVPLIGYYDLALHPLLYRLLHFGEFEILPRIWSALMKARRRSKSLKR